MNFTLSFPDDFDDFKNVKAFTLLRDHVFPVLEERRADLEAMYSRFEEWEPWYSRYENRNPAELRKASADTLKATMTQAGKDVLEVLNSVALKMKSAIDKEPVELLRRVFNEQFEVLEGGEIAERKSTSSGSVKNPNDPDAGWSTKGSIGKEGWVGYKMQVCETTPDKNPFALLAH